LTDDFFAAGFFCTAFLVVGFVVFFFTRVLLSGSNRLVSTTY
jgi:hypothetical protein